MQLQVRYTTRYRYTQPARRVVQLLRVTPHSFPGQTVLDWRIDVDSDARLREQRDGYGNIVHMLYVDQPQDGLAVRVTGQVLTEDRAGVVGGLPGDLPPAAFLRGTALTAIGDALRRFIGELGQAEGSRLERLHLLSHRIHAELRFDTGATGIGTNADEAYAAGHGVCQDFTHIFIAAARGLGIPARYVSGHLFRRDEAPVQPATHAWAEAHDPELGWVAFDPTNGISADDAYVRIACGLDYHAAAPFAGTVQGGGEQRLEVTVDVQAARHDAVRGEPESGGEDGGGGGAERMLPTRPAAR